MMHVNWWTGKTGTQKDVALHSIGCTDEGTQLCNIHYV